jgi:hypothetical protein
VVLATAQNVTQTFEFRNDTANAVIAFLVAIELRALSFSSFAVLVWSPHWNYSELKFLTTAQSWFSGGVIELTSYEFLGEDRLVISFSTGHNQWLLIHIYTHFCSRNS